MKKWIEHFKQKGIPSVYSENSGTTGGCGFAKNCAVKQSHGKYLCFQDADDVMYPERIAKQVEVLKNHPSAIVGTHFEYLTVLLDSAIRRKPENSMRHYSEWMNKLTDADLELYQYREVLIIQPTWMMTRETFDKVGGYSQPESESGPYPEVDTVFYFVKHARILTSTTVI